MMNENEKEKNEIENLNESEEQTAADPAAAGNEIVPENGEEKAPVIEEQPEKKEIYAFRWSYGEQYVHDKEENSQKAPKRQSKSGVWVFLTVIVLAFAFAFGILFLSLNFDDMARWFADDPEVAMSVSEITEKGMPSTVSIYANNGTGALSVGSGFVINEYGYVVTNYHVVENSLAITVSDSNRKLYSASLVGYSKENDIAVLYAENCKLSPVTLGDSDLLKLGETVVAIGTPGGDELAFSVSDGIVSGLNRRVAGKSIGMIQTNAPLNPGNSGGPLFDSRGNLVGVVTLKYTFTNVVEGEERLPYDGIAFALPITDVIDQIEAFIRADFETAKIGITGMSAQEGDRYFYHFESGSIYAYETVGNNDYYVDDTGARQMITDEMRADGRNMFLEAEKTGIMVAEVTKGLGAYGKLEVGDVIVAANGKSVTTINELKNLIENMRVGDSITMTFYRNGEKRVTSVVLMTKYDMLTANK